MSSTGSFVQASLNVHNVCWCKAVVHTHTTCTHMHLNILSIHVGVLLYADPHVGYNLV